MNISECMVILLVALLVIKPEQFPEIIYHVSRFIHSFRKCMIHIKEELKDIIDTLPKSKKHNLE